MLAKRRVGGVFVGIWKEQSESEVKKNKLITGGDYEVSEKPLSFLLPQG